MIVFRFSSRQSVSPTVTFRSFPLQQAFTNSLSSARCQRLHFQRDRQTDKQTGNRLRMKECSERASEVTQDAPWPVIFASAAQSVQCLFGADHARLRHTLLFSSCRQISGISTWHGSFRTTTRFSPMFLKKSRQSFVIHLVSDDICGTFVFVMWNDNLYWQKSAREKNELDSYSFKSFIPFRINSNFKVFAILVSISNVSKSRISYDSDKSPAFFSFWMLLHTSRF